MSLLWCCRLPLMLWHCHQPPVIVVLLLPAIDIMAIDVRAETSLSPTVVLNGVVVPSTAAVSVVAALSTPPPRPVVMVVALDVRLTLLVTATWHSSSSWRRSLQGSFLLSQGNSTAVPMICQVLLASQGSLVFKTDFLYRSKALQLSFCSGHL